AEEISTGNREVARHRRARCDQDGVVAGAEVSPGDVLADLDAGAEASALFLHLVQPRFELPLLHLEVGDAVTQQSADAVIPLEHGDRVTGTRELLCGRKTSRTGADDRDGLAGEP